MNTNAINLTVGDYDLSAPDESAIPATVQEVASCLQSAKKLRLIWARQNRDCAEIDRVISLIRKDFYAATRGEKIYGLPLIEILPLVAEVNLYAAENLKE